MPRSPKRKAKEHHITVRAVPRAEPDRHRLVQVIIAIAKAELAARQAGGRTKRSRAAKLRPPVVPTAQPDADASQRVRHTRRSKADPFTDPHQRQA